MRAPLVAISRRMKCSNMVSSSFSPSSGRAAALRANALLVSRHPPRKGCSIRGRTAGLDRPGPFFDFAFYEISEISRSGAVIGNDLSAKPFEALLDHRRVHGLQRCIIHFLDDCVWCVLGQE